MAQQGAAEVTAWFVRLTRVVFVNQIGDVVNWFWYLCHSKMAGSFPPAFLHFAQGAVADLAALAALAALAGGAAAGADTGGVEPSMALNPRTSFPGP